MPTMLIAKGHGLIKLDTCLFVQPSLVKNPITLLKSLSSLRAKLNTAHKNKPEQLLRIIGGYQAGL